jgi:hypothetical protein
MRSSIDVAALMVPQRALEGAQGDTVPRPAWWRVRISTGQTHHKRYTFPLDTRSLRDPVRCVVKLAVFQQSRIGRDHGPAKLVHILAADKGAVPRRRVTAPSWSRQMMQFEWVPAIAPPAGTHGQFQEIAAGPLILPPPSERQPEEAKAGPPILPSPMRFQPEDIAAKLTLDHDTMPSSGTSC